MNTSKKPKNCIYVYPKGVNKGERCNRPVDDEVDFVYCRLHFNMFCNRFYEGKDMGLVFPDAATEYRFKKICLDPKIMDRSKKYRDLRDAGKLPAPPVFKGPLKTRPGVIPKDSKIDKILGTSPRRSPPRKSPPKKSPKKKKVSFADQKIGSPKVKKLSPPYPGFSPVHCKAFLKNPTYNPITGRNIKIGGPVHRKLEQWCSDASPPRRVSRKTSEVFKSFEKLKQICDEWNKNRNIDPVTRKRIVPADEVYKQLVSRCSQFDKQVKPPAVPQKTLKKPITRPDAPQFQIVYDKKAYQIPKKIGIWNIDKKIGAGGFGTIFACYSDSAPGIMRAIKIEHKSSGCLFYESHVYNKIKAEMSTPRFIPMVFDRGIEGDLRYLVIESLSPLKYSPSMIPDIVKNLEKFAKIKRTHGDVKLDNIMRRPTDGEIVMIDLGLSWPIKDELPKPCNVAGTPLFMSVNAHDGILTYKNDLESLVYVVFDAIHKLPWEGFKNKTKTQMTDIRNSKEKFKRDIVNKTDQNLVKNFKLDEFPVLRLFAKYVFELKGMKYPDYDFIVSLFKK